VRGFGPLSFEHRRDFLDDAIGISHHVVIPKAQNQVSHRLKNARATSVSFRCHRMLPAIELNDQMSVGTKEIDDKAVDGKLPAKFPSVKPSIPQTKPQYTLGVRLIAS